MFLLIINWLWQGICEILQCVVAPHAVVVCVKCRPHQREASSCSNLVQQAVKNRSSPLSVCLQENIESKKRERQQRGNRAVKTVRKTLAATERGLYTADTWSVSITEPCDRPLRVSRPPPCKSLLACYCASLSAWVSSCRLHVSAC